MKTVAHNQRRRLLLSAGGGLLLSATLIRRADSADEIEISLAGTPTGAHVWFRPRGLLIQPGQTVRWVNRETGNVHTSTAYHPDNGKPQRIPHGAKSWDSGYLMPNESFAMVLEVPGVYDYFCIPHEQAGMVGRIVVGQVDASIQPYADTDALLPEPATAAFADVGEILKETRLD
ncbi:plastocyanin/azurin family copper-binding protein [Pusillimonas sp.]|uniref:plastocyanin/azurin family copper-binding protein n=1 Tax=Pusillimonas sp. TaxID=3040095 RepID=UPI0037C9834F